LREKYEHAVAAARELWERDQHAHALAEIRRNERDSLVGPLLSPLRRDMERSLGLAFTANERWRPLRIPLFVWALGFLLFAASIFLLVFRRREVSRREDSRRDNSRHDASQRETSRRVTSRRRSGFQSITVAVLLAGLLLTVLEAGRGTITLRRFTSAIGSTAVLGQTPAHRVPDAQGVINVWFDEGQSVIVGAYNLEWAYVQSPDGRSGWVAREALIIY
jgi:membrane protein implicated in regulation of membrane protease activity